MVAERLQGVDQGCATSTWSLEACGELGDPAARHLHRGSLPRDIGCREPCGERCGRSEGCEHWQQGRLADEQRLGRGIPEHDPTRDGVANDDRIVGWDIWNEPNNSGGGNYKPTPDKHKYVALLLPRFFAAARSADPIQPLTSGVWIGDHWDDQSKVDAVEKIQLRESDVMSFHDYSWPETFDRRARQMMSYGRPVWCTEYMARGNGSTFDNTLPIGKKLNIAMYNWGFVDGKMQTRLPWDSWKKPYTYEEPTIWFHDILYFDGKPYRQAEVDLIRRMAAAPKGVVPAGK